MKKTISKHSKHKDHANEYSPHERILDKKGHPKPGEDTINKKIKQHDNSGGLA